MGILDKARTQAQQIAQKAQEGAKGAQDKLEEVQAKKRADTMLRELGAWHHALHEGRDSGRAAGEIARLHGSLRAHETEHGALPLPFEMDAGPSAAATPEEPSGSTGTPLPGATNVPPTGATQAGALRTPVAGREGAGGTA